MNSKKTTLQSRAAYLFIQEEQSQALAGWALAQQNRNPTVAPLQPCTSIDDLVQNIGQNLLDKHSQLQEARNHAAQLGAENKRLGSLNQLIYDYSQHEWSDDEPSEDKIKLINPL